jgi:carbohydrate-selective porin OprB
MVLYEDADFALRVSKIGVYLNTAAQLHHYHDVQGNNQYQYGKMVVRNGWYVWRVKIQTQNGETGSSGMPSRYC